MGRILNSKEQLTKEKLVELISSAKQDEMGHWYIERPKDKLDIKLGTGGQRIYFGMFYTVCEDFVKAFTDAEEQKDKTEHYNRHFINDDTFELWVAKDLTVLDDDELEEFMREPEE